MVSDPLIAAAIAAFESAARSFESARLLLHELVDQVEARDNYFQDDTCHHPDAIEVSTLGDGMPVWVCPDCGESIE
jgi:hypothetical protein